MINDKDRQEEQRQKRNAEHKENNNFLHARAIHHAILMIYKTLYETIQTQYTITRQGARHSHSTGVWQASQLNFLVACPPGAFAQRP
jgi:hypothetical protein